MKPETVKTLVAWFWIVMALVVAFLLWAYTRPASAQEAQETEPFALRMRPCAPPECVLVHFPDLMEAVRRSNENWERAKKAEAELAKLKASCVAKVEVIPDGTRKRS